MDSYKQVDVSTCRLMKICTAKSFIPPLNSSPWPIITNLRAASKTLKSFIRLFIAQRKSGNQQSQKDKRKQAKVYISHLTLLKEQLLHKHFFFKYFKSINMRGN